MLYRPFGWLSSVLMAAYGLNIVLQIKAQQNARICQVHAPVATLGSFFPPP